MLYVAIHAGQRDGHGLYRLSCEALAEVVAPVRVEAAVCRTQRFDRHVACAHQGNPCRIRAEARPARAAQCEHHRIGAHLLLAGWCHEAQRWARGAGCVRGVIVAPAHPFVPHVKPHAGLFQAMQPGAQHGRRFHVGGKHASRTAYEGFNTQVVQPCTECIRTECIEQRRNLVAPRAVASEKRLERLRMRDVHATFARHQEFASDRRHRVVHVNAHAALG
jgi:hypothetical protein